MSSILTNNGAMVALQTLQSINKNLGSVQEQISTGKSVGSAKDNSAVWAISKTMESDKKGFESISSSLALGQSTVAVARTAAETVTDLLTDMKGKIVAAQEENVDREKIQTDISALRDQINSVVGAAQFNGLNMVDGSAGTTNILSSLDRASDGTVTASQITVASQDLSTGGYVAKAAFTGSAGASTAADTFATTLAAGATAASNIAIPAATTFAAGDSITINVGDKSVTHTISAADVASTTTSDVIAVALKDKIDALGVEGLVVDYDSGSPGVLSITGDGGVAGTTKDLTITGSFKNAGSGGLGALSSIDVTTDASSALTAVEGLIATAIDAAAEFGSAQGRINIQADFMEKLTDSFTSGIGSLVDANMEETSARLQALQVQQQLATQSLSIANQAPQSILSLFR